MVAGEGVNRECIARVRGDVQGVGFRWWARDQLGRLGLTGSATNLMDGSVEVVARALPEGIEIRVSDSGLGLPAGEDDGPYARPASTSYGLQHVRDRLQVLYGPAARLSLERRDPTGVCAVVFIPT